MKRPTISLVLWKVIQLAARADRRTLTGNDLVRYAERINAAATNEIKRLINHKINEG